ncbi:MAG: hypothetical protein AAF639_24965 [Chloroflexota bacterium]
MVACAYPMVQLTATAKRNLRSLWKDITTPPYTQLFNPHLTAFRLWRCVEVARVDERP